MAKRSGNNVDDSSFDSSILTGTDPLTKEAQGAEEQQQKPPTGCLVSVLLVFLAVVIFSLYMFFAN